VKTPQTIHLTVPAVIVFMIFVLVNPIVPFDNARQSVIPCSVKNKTGPGTFCWTPEVSDIEKADKIIIDCIAQRNRSADLLNAIAKNGFGSYFRQYEGTFGDNGEKLIRIYCMCALPTSHADWRRNKIMIIGGGHCYFNAVVYPAGMKCVEFHVNSTR